MQFDPFSNTLRKQICKIRKHENWYDGNFDPIMQWIKYILSRILCPQYPHHRYLSLSLSLAFIFIFNFLRERRSIFSLAFSSNNLRKDPPLFFLFIPLSSSLRAGQTAGRSNFVDRWRWNLSSIGDNSRHRGVIMTDEPGGSRGLFDPRR